MVVLILAFLAHSVVDFRLDRQIDGQSGKYVRADLSLGKIDVFAFIGSQKTVTGPA